MNDVLSAPPRFVAFCRRFLPVSFAAVDASSVWRNDRGPMKLVYSANVTSVAVSINICFDDDLLSCKILCRILSNPMNRPKKIFRG